MNVLARNLVILALATASMATTPYSPTDAERARWTMSDMNSWRICFAACKQDHGAYPVVKNAAEAKALFEPKYVMRLPMHDAWGNDYDVSATESTFRVVSPGADGKFDRGSWSTGGELSSFDADATATQDGRWLFRHWAMK